MYKETIVHCMEGNDHMFAMLGTILSGLFGKSATLEYPKKPKQNDPLVRGHIENDIDLCIFCGICKRKCPTEAIDVTKTDKMWSIERFRCIVCNCCVEVCPKKCLHMRPELTSASTTMTKDIQYARVSSDTADHPNG